MFRNIYSMDRVVNLFFKYGTFEFLESDYGENLINRYYGVQTSCIIRKVCHYYQCGGPVMVKYYCMEIF